MVADARSRRLIAQQLEEITLPTAVGPRPRLDCRLLSAATRRRWARSVVCTSAAGWINGSRPLAGHHGREEFPDARPAIGREAVLAARSHLQEQRIGLDAQRLVNGSLVDRQLTAVHRE